MINKKKYFTQIENLKLARGIEEKDFIKLFDIAVGTMQVSAKEIDKLINNVMENLFANPAFNEPLVPWSFWNTEIGKAILQVQFEIYPNDMYLVHEVAEIAKISIQQVSKDAKATPPKLIGEQRGEKGKIWVFKERDVNNYLASKGIFITAQKSSVYKGKEENLSVIGYEREVKYGEE